MLPKLLFCLYFCLKIPVRLKQHSWGTQSLFSDGQTLLSPCTKQESLAGSMLGLSGEGGPSREFSATDTTAKQWEIQKGRVGWEEEALGTHRKTIFPAPSEGSLLPELALGVLKSDVLLVQLPAKLQAASLCFLQVQPRFVPLPGNLPYLDPMGTASGAFRVISHAPQVPSSQGQHPYLRHCSLYPNEVTAAH